MRAPRGLLGLQLLLLLLRAPQTAGRAKGRPSDEGAPGTTAGGGSDEEHCEGQRGPGQSVAGGGQWGKPWPPDFIERLAPATRAIVGGAFELHEGGGRAAL